MDEIQITFEPHDILITVSPDVIDAQRHGALRVT